MVEIVFDRPLPVGVVTTITLTDASGDQTIVYEVAVPEIPTTSTWGLFMFAWGAIIAGGVVLRRRAISRVPVDGTREERLPDRPS